MEVYADAGVIFCIVFFYFIFFGCKCRTPTNNLERKFSTTANWPLNQLCLLRYANDREAERWLKLPFTSTLHCFPFSTKKKTVDDCRWTRGAESFNCSQSCDESPPSHRYCVWHQCCIPVPAYRLKYCSTLFVQLVQQMSKVFRTTKIQFVLGLPNY